MCCVSSLWAALAAVYLLALASVGAPLGAEGLEGLGYAFICCLR